MRLLFTLCLAVGALAHPGGWKQTHRAPAVGGPVYAWDKDSMIGRQAEGGVSGSEPGSAGEPAGPVVEPPPPPPMPMPHDRPHGHGHGHGHEDRDDDFEDRDDDDDDDFEGAGKEDLYVPDFYPVDCRGLESISQEATISCLLEAVARLNDQVAAQTDVMHAVEEQRHEGGGGFIILLLIGACCFCAYRRHKKRCCFSNRYPGALPMYQQVPPAMPAPQPYYAPVPVQQQQLQMPQYHVPYPPPPQPMYPVKEI
eukprot:TRINITY_DN321_c0_g1_i4.p1 TRINITY_DN321_c0_g1~~TRINITY_DN321_c0_g1_i4.p1  ORF type:complete len:270 (-),score=60.16 TRINITY_DN321_c0_g1_i4:78-839(-)